MSSPRRNTPPSPPDNRDSTSPPMYYDRHHHYHSRQDPLPHPPYLYTPHPPFDQPRYEHPFHPPPPGIPSHFSVPTMSQPMRDNYGRHYPVPGAQNPVPIVHTDDAATKLTDGIRRRCFNCCTTDTSTWRRSNLSPGKVLCNKCGLFERTHSRPRPDQFPHKRGPLATSTLRGRTPPGSTQLPPISANPYQYHHGSLTPLNTSDYHQSQQLPGLQSWQNTSGSSSTSSVSAHPANNGHDSHHSHSSNNDPGPLLLPRRPTLDSPRMSSNSNPTSRTSSQQQHRSFDDSLSSNAPSDSHSRPASPPPMSRSSTSHSHREGTSSANRTPPPTSSTSNARDPPV